MEARTLMWAFLTGKIAGPLFLGVSALLLIACGVLYWRVDDVTDDRDKLSAEINTPQTGYRDRLTQCQTNSAQLAQNVSDQNTKIDNLRLIGDNRRKEADARQQKVDAALTAARRRIAGLINASKARLPNENACQHALRMFKEVEQP
jgi:hypothetical protein